MKNNNFREFILRRVLVTEDIYIRVEWISSLKSQILKLCVSKILIQKHYEQRYVTLTQSLFGQQFSQLISCKRPEAKIVSRHGVGCDNIDVDHLSARGIPVAIASGSNALSVAEHTLGLMLATARNLVNQDTSVKRGLLG